MGANHQGQLGLSSTPTYTSTPILLNSSSSIGNGTIVGVACGNLHSMVVVRQVDGEIQFWGFGSNDYGQLGCLKHN